MAHTTKHKQNCAHRRIPGTHCTAVSATGMQPSQSAQSPMKSKGRHMVFFTCTMQSLIFGGKRILLLLLLTLQPPVYGKPCAWGQWQ